MRITLASASERRKGLLKKIVRQFRVKAASVNERILPNEAFAHSAVRLAEAKARKVAAQERGSLVIGADTIAYRGRKAYRKTDDGQEAGRILRELAGKTHTVVTGVAVVFPNGRRMKYSVKASVSMKKLNAKMINGYLKSGEWKGRAGCYDYSGMGRKLVASVRGGKETVVGLPLKRLKRILGRH